MRVAIIGAGGIAREHRRGYARLEGVELVGIVDPSPDARGRAASEWNTRGYETVQQLLDEARPEAVSICNPPGSHAEAATACLARGVAVLCEKPMARNVEEAESMVDAARRTGTPLGVAFCHRFHTPVSLVRDAVVAGRLGRVAMFRNRFGGKQNTRGRWLSDIDAAGGGALMDTAVHSVDLFRFLVGEPAWVSAAIADVSGAYSLEDSGILLLGTADGAMGTIEASWSTPYSNNAVEIYGTDGAAVVDYNTGDARIFTRDDNNWQAVSWSGPDRFEREIEAFVYAVRDGAPLPVTGEDGLAANRILGAAYHSANTGARVAL
jgi:predicted dehydrogenase